MKQIIFILIIFGLYSCNIQSKSNIGYSYRIVKIDSIENVYLIYAERSDVNIKNTVLKIVSAKTEKNCKKNKRIALENNYKLNVFSLYPKNLVSHNLGGITFNGVLIPFDKDYNIKKDLFITEDLKGLCYRKW
ncbi:MAG: hypothetical protein LBE92_10905 [Chryseobacterium sp.]|jgi:hypothetical protein|uniref:hypothetical protein n=1 Tax=Chryseobacterium sp. TaxID=1871047 RepID=UPI00281A72F5|nr:hypothetical protein [Chryseobacterium sp.]MDR2236623.1 hypothetical protein [Chryseobacterium sp.]